MKVFKKLSMLFVAAAMMMTTVSTTFAAEDMSTGQGELTINREGASYNAYQILDSKNKKVGDKNLTIYSVNEEFKAFFDGNPYKFDADKGIQQKNETTQTFEVLTTPAGDGLLTAENLNLEQSEEMKALTEKLIQYIETKSIKATNVSGSTNEKLTQGYYLVTENTTSITSNGQNTGRVPSKAMLMDINPKKAVIINPKDAEITIEKKVNGAESNVAGVGEVIPFKITSTVPTYAANYKNIVYKVSDTMSKGLTLDKESLDVTVGTTKVIKDGVVLDASYLKDGAVTYTTEKENTKMVIDFNYETLRTAAKMGEPVEITYKAEVNTDAVIFNANTNDVTLDYTVNPDGTTDGIKDHTDTYTYGIRILKIDGNANNADAEVKNPLAGATFKVTKVDASGTVIKEVGNITTDATGLGSINGLGNGYYTLVETNAPAGYALLDGAITIKVTNKDDLKNATIELVNVSGEIANLDANVTNNGLIEITIKNYKGINMPETGGMGTTIFMIGGAALIALAGVMLVVYSKKSKKA